MAERIQIILDEMVPALRDLLNQGIFNEKEVHSIVSKRRMYEYRIQDTDVEPSLYLEYAESEQVLERLRVLRFQKQKLTYNQRRTNAVSVGNLHIIKHINSIYKRLTGKFGSSNVDLFLTHAKFAKSTKSYRVLSMIYTEAMQHHPKSSIVWIEAASHAFFGDIERSGSIAPARVLMQRGIRLNQHNVDLYVQYFNLELHYIQKLRGRKILLEKAKHKDSKREEPEPDQEEEVNFEIPRIIFRNAIKAVPNDVKMRFDFIQTCLDFPETEELQKEIMDSIEMDFGHLPDTWIARAQCLLDKNKHNDALHIIKNSLAAITTPEMYSKAILLLLQLDLEDSSNVRCLLQECIQDILSNPKKLQNQELLSASVTYLLECGHIQKAQDILKPNTKSATTWIQYSSLLYRINQAQNISTSSQPLFNMLEQAVSSLPMYDSNHTKLLHVYFDSILSFPSTTYLSKLQTTFETMALLSNLTNENAIQYLCYTCLIKAQVKTQIDFVLKNVKNANLMLLQTCAVLFKTHNFNDQKVFQPLLQIAQNNLNHLEFRDFEEFCSI